MRIPTISQGGNPRSRDDRVMQIAGDKKAIDWQIFRTYMNGNKWIRNVKNHFFVSFFSNKQIKFDAKNESHRPQLKLALDAICSYITLCSIPRHFGSRFSIFLILQAIKSNHGNISTTKFTSNAAITLATKSKRIHISVRDCLFDLLRKCKLIK